MRILLVATSSTGGGAANACIRLFEALLALGADVRLLTMLGEPLGERHEVLARQPMRLLRHRAAKLAERLQILAHCRGQKANLWRLSTATFGIDISGHPWVQWADVLHLHWVSQGFLSLSSLARLARFGKPIAWTLHDLWAVTGGCHIPYLFGSHSAQLCPHLAQGCGACPLLPSTQGQDLTARLYRQKAFLARTPFHYIAVSSAAEAAARLSPHFSTASIDVIAPPMEIEAMRNSPAPAPSWYAPNRIYLLVAAARLDDKVKGEELLREVCSEVCRLAPDLAPRLTLLLVGTLKGGYEPANYALHSIYIGLVRSGEELRSLYRLASLTLSTSLFETFGQTLTEALAMGCPVVGFASGGPMDIIRSGENGYLAPAYDVRAYAQFVLEALTGVADGRLTKAACRASVERFAPEQIAQQHLRLYERLLCLYG